MSITFRHKKYDKNIPDSGKSKNNNKLKNNNNYIVKTKCKLKAASLINAIFICVIISIFCGCLILISHYQNILNNSLFFKEDLISRNRSSFNYFLNNSESINYNEVKEIDVFEDGIISYLEKKNWGFYDILICKTIFKNDTINKIALVGNIKNDVNDLALYVTNYDKTLKLSGNIRILGDLKIPDSKTEQVYINGQKGNTIQLKGKQLKSSKRLPKIEKDIYLDISNLPRLNPNNIYKKPIVVNEFDSPTKVINLDNISVFKDVTCKGNFVLSSSNKLEIDSSAKLNDVVVIAPSVRVRSGFRGNIQIIAKEEVFVENNVSLLYPSSIYIKNDVDSVSVKIMANSKLAGGIVIDGNMYNSSLKRQLTIDEKAIIIGNVYCYGRTQLKGDIIGNIYTDRFFLETNASNYENVILNASIDKEALSEMFIELPLFNNTTNKKEYAVIKEF
ncbi:hypothetical protein A8C32_10470 [Flavivirga aquatica]|uniref:Polymer-forming cytoskeletal protein n=1 Tax=Flavivirga aquatica TaxID=1849968 RepID=A0A1E5TCT2_9FLAO|nr:hypothetical protein [Flavivirga aquatica]OEK09149.1 hypothetical protein A8C32_10470 [Flavivirga aquatica]